MKVYIMTDIEGVCGLVNFEDWARPEGRYYEEGRKLLTLEVNAAVEGFYAAGATEILVADGHGPGAVNPLLLDKRTMYARGFPGPYPFLLDDSFDAIAWVGQHAKSGAPYAHLPHTGAFSVFDYRVNGISVGEFGQMALIAASLGVYSIFASGDEALTSEAKQLIPGVETVAVKKGVTPGSGDECDSDAYRKRNTGCIHMHPEKARELIREHAEKALIRYKENRESFTLLKPAPPYRRDVEYRANGNEPAYKAYSEHPDNLIRMMNMPYIRL